MEQIRYLTADEIRTTGILQEVNRTFFHPLGLAAEVNLETGSILIQDHRYDTEGVIYADGVMDADKFQNFVAFCRDRHARRIAVLGFVNQPLPGECITCA